MIRNGRSRIYLSNTYPNRTNEAYILQVNESIKNISIEYDIIGKCFFFFRFCFISTCNFNRLHALLHWRHIQMDFSLLIKRINCREPYYLGLKLKDIDNLLSKSKHPKEYPREQHEIKFFNNFLANELKTLLMNSSI